MTQDQEKASLTVDDILSIGRRAMDKCHGTEAQHIYIAREVERRLQAAPAAVPVGWTGNPDADLALILLDRLDDSGEGNATRIDQLEGLVRKLAADHQPAQAVQALVPAQCTPALKRHALEAADRLAMYAAAPFFPDTEKRGVKRATTAEWWDGLAELIEEAQPLIKRGLHECTAPLADLQAPAVAHAAAPQPEAQPQWRPIETAPKDGTHIWMYDPLDHQAVGYWLSCEEWKGWVFADELLADAKPDGMTPTHWMPLPAAPSAQAEQADQAPAPAPEPVAVRYDFDGYGWKYIDNGSGSDWMTRHPDGELLYDDPCAAVGDGWISVRDRLPPKFEEVLVAFEGISLASTGQYTDNARDKHGWCYPAENYGTCDDGSDPVVTHWMPLPTAPGFVVPVQGSQP